MIEFAIDVCWFFGGLSFLAFAEWCWDGVRSHEHRRH
jgi:hypothetical protein